MDTLLRALAEEGAVRVLAVDLTETASEMAAVHSLERGGLRIGADALVASTLLSATIGEEERITLQIQGERPRFGFAADVDGEGSVRGRLAPGTLPDDATFGGLMMVIKSSPEKELYRGVTRVVEESIESALSTHLAQSDQLDVALRIGVRVIDGGYGFVGGLLVDRLPDAPDQASITAESFDRIRAAIVSEEVDELVMQVRAGEFLRRPARVMGERPLVWRCRCSTERVEGMLAGLGDSELRAMANEDHGAEVACHFCRTVYSISEQRLLELAAL